MHSGQPTLGDLVGWTIASEQQRLSGSQSQRVGNARGQEIEMWGDLELVQRVCLCPNLLDCISCGVSILLESKSVVI